MPKVSIIIPIYNVEKYLSECLDSVLNQTLKDIEIICVNDGSLDNSCEILKEYAKKDSRILLIDKQNGGYGSACNLGLDKAIGEYIAIVEPDDYIDENMYEELYKIAQKFDSDIVKSGFYDNLQSKTKTRLKQVKWDDDKIPQDKSFKIEECPLFLSYHPSVWSCIYKREFLSKQNIKFIEAPGAGWTDNPFQVQTMCLAEKINYTPKAYYYWRRLNENGSDDLKDYTIPFKRSNEIHKWLKENNIKDLNILGCLYERELAYIQIVLDKKYSKPELKNVFEEINKMSKRMELDIILNCKFLKKRNCKKLIEIKKNLKSFYYKQKLNKFRKNLISIKLNKNEKVITILGKVWRING